MQPTLAIANLGKKYQSGGVALADVTLSVNKGEIFALLGPNGAGKTTLISIVCGIVTPTSGTVHVDGKEIREHYRAVGESIGLVPQDLTTDTFETVLATVKFSRSLF